MKRQPAVYSLQSRLASVYMTCSCRTVNIYKPKRELQPLHTYVCLC